GAVAESTETHRRPEEEVRRAAERSRSQDSRAADRRAESAAEETARVPGRRGPPLELINQSRRQGLGRASLPASRRRGNTKTGKLPRTLAPGGSGGGPPPPGPPPPPGRGPLIFGPEQSPGGASQETWHKNLF